MPNCAFFLTSSLEKVFPTQKPPALPEGATLTVLRGELPALQLVYTKLPGETDWPPRPPHRITVENAPVPARLRSVEVVPSDFPCYARRDAGYLTTEPGLFPDLLRPLEGDCVYPLAEQYRALWIDFPGLEAAAPGRYDITVRAAAVPEYTLPNGAHIRAEAPGEYACRFTLEVLPVSLPAQTLLHTEWFHCDGLSQYYDAPVFSEEFWRIVENFIALAGEELGINVCLTPIFTPPLDTAVGGERRTVQLVDIERDGETYRFGFEKLGRWCALCARHGITHLEMAHFFTQWGATATPKIIARVDGVDTRIFGWDVPASDARYRAFLKAFVPALRAALAGFGYDDAHVIYHISDEPGEAHLESYRAAKAQVADLLEGCYILDALSDYTYYASGLIEHPVPANDHIQPFFEQRVPGLWVYYCCSQCVDVPNRFFALPSARNRVMGILLYLYDIAGFLHWGYNFYNAQFSLRPLNPFVETHAGYGFPSGDAFLVYPGEGGVPLSSIRAQVQRIALDDLGTLRALEALSSREFVVGLIQEGFEEAITFRTYPRDAAYFLALREKVGAEIAKRC